MLLAEPRALRIVKWLIVTLAFTSSPFTRTSMSVLPALSTLHPARPIPGLRGRIAGTGHSPRGSSIHHDRGAIVGHTGTLQHKADQALSRLIFAAA